MFPNKSTAATYENFSECQFWTWIASGVTTPTWKTFFSNKIIQEKELKTIFVLNARMMTSRKEERLKNAFKSQTMITVSIKG